MRMRKKKHGAERIEACSHLLITPNEEFKADVQSAFSEQRPIHLEIGCGKGNFAVGMSGPDQSKKLLFTSKEWIVFVKVSIPFKSGCLVWGLFCLLISFANAQNVSLDDKISQMLILGFKGNSTKSFGFKKILKHVFKNKFFISDISEV